VVLPTGSGKSICYMLPAVLKRSITVVVLPLLALLRDQVKRLKDRDISVGVVRGGIREKEYGEIREGIEKGEVGIVFTTPEALSLKRNISFFKGLGISSVVIDEAHCVAEWGESFRPSYLKLDEFINNFSSISVTAFTATASGMVLKKIKKYLFKGRNPFLVAGNPDRPNIKYSVMPCISKGMELQRAVLKENKPMIVFTRSRKRAEGTARRLSLYFERNKSVSINLKFYHAGLTNEERRSIEEWFLKSDNGILCATSAYGLGVDKRGIRTVIHYDIPRSVESYLQESGRAGRDGTGASAVLLYSVDDFLFFKELSDKVDRERYSVMLKYVLNDEVCRREQLLSAMDWKNIKCSGCDVCSGEVLNLPEGFNEIENFIAKHKRLFSLKTAVQVLKGTLSYATAGDYPDRFREFGLLCNWSKNNLEEALQSMLQSRRFLMPKRGFFKYRLTSIGKGISWKENLMNFLKSGRENRGM
ncbi:MAG: ATP-dependent DNA helicase RecQ, partial [Spirochaetes bacterium]|nr:ATP-dependent DNA helicase RecQ [Spirochaetota bacterium]